MSNSVGTAFVAGAMLTVRFAAVGPAHVPGDLALMTMGFAPVVVAVIAVAPAASTPAVVRRRRKLLAGRTFTPLTWGSATSRTNFDPFRVVPAVAGSRFEVRSTTTVPDWLTARTTRSNFAESPPDAVSTIT